METDRNQFLTRGPWAARLPVDDAPAVGSLRLDSRIRACLIDSEIWLRGDEIDDDLFLAIQRLAPSGFFSIVADDRLTLWGNLLPMARLSVGDWRPLDQLIAVEPPVAALKDRIDSRRVSLRLVRDEQVRPATLLLTALQAWVSYGETAAAARLRPLCFAASSEDALIRGTPLPPLPGRYFYEENGIVVPCGFIIAPTVDVETLRLALLLKDDELTIFFDEERWQVLPASNFVQARRSAVRLTARAAAEER